MIQPAPQSTQDKGEEKMSDAELVALATLVNAETEGMRAENQIREHRGEAIAYDFNAFAFSPLADQLWRELRRRGRIR